MTDCTIANVNLVPNTWRSARLRTRYIKNWALAASATTLLVGLPGLYIGGNATLSDPSINAQIEQVSAQLSTNRSTIPELKKQLAQLQERQQVLALVESRIDWRDVFAQFVAVSKDRVRFVAIRATGAGVDATGPIEVQVEAIAPSQTDARAFVVAIESLKLFDEINLTRTQRREIEQQEVIEFQVVARISPASTPQEPTQ